MCVEMRVSVWRAQECEHAELRVCECMESFERGECVENSECV